MTTEPAPTEPAPTVHPSPAEVAKSMWDQDLASRAAGMVLVDVGEGRAVISMTVGPAHVNGLGVCHGGYLFMLADSAMAFASNSRNEVALAAAAQVDFLRSARLGDVLEATAVMRADGKRTGITDVEVRLVPAPASDPGQGRPLVALMRGRTSKTGARVLG